MRVFCLFNICLLGLIGSALGHGGHHFRTEAPLEAPSLPPPANGKSFSDPTASPNTLRWGASLETGWTSRELHYGVNETGNSGAWTTEFLLTLDRLTLGVWSGFGIGNDFQEWDFSASWTFETDTIFFIPGYTFRFLPGITEDGSEHSHDDEGHDAHDEHDAPQSGHAAHLHQTSSHELFFTLGTKALPFITPSMNFVWDLSNTPGVYLDFRLDGDIPLLRDTLSLHPYVLVSLNLGYNTRSYYGWNHAQFGIEASWKLTRNISLTGGIEYSVALPALQTIGQNNVVWAKTGVRLEF